jgi:hypothetical protein
MPTSASITPLRASAISYARQRGLSVDSAVLRYMSPDMTCPRQSGLLKPYMRPIHAGARTSCTAVTVLLQPGDNGMLHVVADQIEDIIATRIVQAAPGVPVEDLVARGDVALGFQQLSELIHLPGIDVLGGLPPEIQLNTVFSAAISYSST